MRAKNGAPMEFIRYAANIESESCVMWPYSREEGRYGIVMFNGRAMSPSRAVLILKTGQDPAGVQAAHGPCNTPACINPAHLRWATHAENMSDKVRDGTLFYRIKTQSKRRGEMTLRLTQEEKQQVEVMARLQKTTQAEVIRAAIAEAVRKARVA